MVTDALVRHLIRLMLLWVLIAITSIVIGLTLVFWVLDLDDPYEATEHALLLLLPVTAYQLGEVNRLGGMKKPLPLRPDTFV
jgi:hypothetical protein